MISSTTATTHDAKEKWVEKLFISRYYNGRGDMWCIKPKSSAFRNTAKIFSLLTQAMLRPSQIIVIFNVDRFFPTSVKGKHGEQSQKVDQADQHPRKSNIFDHDRGRKCLSSLHYYQYFKLQLWLRNNLFSSALCDTNVRKTDIQLVTRQIAV